MLKFPRMRGNLLLAVLLTAMLLPAWAKPVARVQDIDGDKNLFVLRPKQAKWYRAHLEMDAALGDHLKTDAATLATLQFLLGGRANIDQSTEIEIVSSKDADVVSVDLKTGSLWARFDKQKTPVKIRTAGGVMGIRGTELVVTVDQAGLTTMSLLEGEVEVEPAQGQPYAAGPGARVTFGPDTPLSVVLERLEDMRSRLERDLGRLSELEPQLQRLQEAQQQIREAQVTIESAGVSGRLDAMQQRLEAAGLAPKTDRSKASPGKAETTWPRLSWPEIPGERFAVMILPQSGEEVLWLGESALPSYTYPADAPPLAPGEYRYRVLPLNAEGQPTGKAFEGSLRVPVPGRPAAGTDGEP